MKSWIFWPFLLIALFLTHSCGPTKNVSIDQELEVIAGNNFFLNSNRRAISKEEQRYILKATKRNQTSGCTAFWVENSQGRFIIGTARHCYKWVISDACKNDEIRILPDGELAGKFEGRCERLIASSTLHDVALIEISLTDSRGKKVSNKVLQTVRESITPLRLADYVPNEYDHLKMYGYPGDEERKGRATTSENCWILPKEAQTVWESLDHSNLERRFERYIERARNAPTDPVVARYRASLRQNRLKYNCSVYGGNSGGPIVLEGTRDVVGLPVTYWPELYTKIPEDHGHELEDMKSFVDHHRETLKSFGISLSRF